MSTASKIQPGDVFVVPLADGTRTLGQVLALETRTLHSVACAFFDQRFSDLASAQQALPDATRCISAILVTPDLLKKGRWEILTNKTIEVPASLFPYEKELSQGFRGAKVRGSGLVETFLNAFYGLAPWDSFADPKYLDQYLLRANLKPSALLTKARD